MLMQEATANGNRLVKINTAERVPRISVKGQAVARIYRQDDKQRLADDNQ